MANRTPVQARGGGYGLDAELAQRAADKYDYEQENEARVWLEAVSHMEIGDDFGTGLKNGVILCAVANEIHPGIVRRVETKSKMPFKLMENVSAFLKACRQMGVSEFDLFETVDLFELKDLGHVVRCIFALGRAVQRNYPQYKGPTLGVKESIKNERQFSSDQLLEARNMPSLMNLGSMRTMPRTEHSSANNVTFGADAANSAYRAPPPPPPPSFAKAQLVTLVRAGKADIDGTIKSQPEEERAPSNGVSWSPAKEISFEQPKESESSNVAQLSVAIEQASLEQISAPATMGLSPTVQKGPTAEQEAQQWIEAVLNEKFLASFGDSLKDGVILCTLMNAIKPGLVGKIQNSPMPFKQMENVTSFIKACRSVGVAEFDLFETVDLFELKNVDQVVKCIHALGRTIQKNVPEFTGPTLGVKESTFNKREFSEAQLKIAKNTVPVLAGASHSVMDRAGFDRSASVTFGADAATHGRFVSKNTASGPSFTAAANAHAAANKADESNTTPEPEVTPVADATSEITTTTNVRQMANRMASVNWTSNGGAAPSVHPPTANGVTPPKASVVLPTRTVWT